VLRKIFGPKREEEVGGWKRLYNEELQNLYASPHIIRIIKSTGMKWTGHVAHMGKMSHSKFWSENLTGRDHSKGLNIDGKILQWVLGK
jgi:hypothetical protein